MYCSNCGKKVDEKAVICVGCGVPLNNSYNTVAKHKSNRGIASMVLGIVGAFIALCEFSTLADLDYYVFFEDYSSLFELALETIIVPIILAIVGICLACVSRKTEKNGFNTAGFWLAIAIFITCAIQFIWILAY